ncbi:TetR/AcrR family transcriptional regulator [Tsukamurella sp. 1534]|uniref:TetR/AcrR family transcriptional regulator n=1 Tax=Tsukamurella sp. 1534 TaxID=1151061 RepID=UPI0002D99634|nr:TetR/AcrR family transcriptional regulator [Tsukamurella sp. 1534]
MSWRATQRSARESAATDRILTAAGELFGRDGVAAVGMAEVAAAAGCSRATLYRYFPTRQALHVAFVEREARTVAATVRDGAAAIDDPADRLATALATAVAEVRRTPQLAAWFSPDEPPAGGLAARSAGIEAVAAGLLHELTGTVDADAAPSAARWLVRVVVSLLSHPERTVGDEDDLVRRFVVPAVLADPAFAATVTG